MKHLSLISLTLLTVLVAPILFCIELPQDPALNPKYADASLLVDDELI